MDPTERFSEIVRRDERAIPLDEACLLIAAHAHPGLDVDAARAQLDELATIVDADDARTLAHRVFRDLGYTGNTVDYDDPRNSYLDDVLERRLGIPITLSILMVEIGRRLGIAVHGVGMPGHFLVGAAPGEWFDPFHGGVALDEEGCRARFAETNGTTPFERRFLHPVGPLVILDRVLANLQRCLAARDPARAAWPTRLRLRLPEVPPARRAELAAMLGSLGRFAEAAAELDAVAGVLAGDDAERVSGAATRLRARNN